MEQEKRKKILDNLNDRFMAENPEVLDDDMPDKFEAWLGEQDLTDEELEAIQQNKTNEKVEQKLTKTIYELANYAKKNEVMTMFMAGVIVRGVLAEIKKSTLSEIIECINEGNGGEGSEDQDY